METDTDYVQVEFLGLGKQRRHHGQRRAEFNAKRTQALGVVREYADHELGAGVGFCDFVELVGVVERHGVNARSSGGADEGDGFARVGEDDAGGVDGALADGEDLVDFAVGSAVEAGSERGEEPDDVWVWVALDSWGESMSFGRLRGHEP